MMKKMMNTKDVCEMFVESFYNNWLGDMTWREVLNSNIDCCSDETWEDLFEEHPNSVYDYCYHFHRSRRIFI